MTESLESRYEFRDQVAGGACGEILLGLDRSTNYSVVIKRLRLRGEDPAELARFEQEADILSSIDSRYVVKFLDYGFDADGRPCMVLERLEGMNLTEWRTIYRATPEQVCRMGAQVARGLDSLHRALVIHRDLKPSNIFVTQNPSGKIRAKILDLGAAKRLDVDPLTVAHIMIGTPAYMAPEQARAGGAVSVQSDVFALGLVLYELLTGKRAFEGPPYVITAQLLLGEIPHILPGENNIAPALIEIVNRALNRDPALRFESALAMANALEAQMVVGALTEERASLERSSLRPAASVREADSSAAEGHYENIEPLAVAEKRVISAVFANFARANIAIDVEVNQRIDAALADFDTIASAHGAQCSAMVGNRAIAVFGFRESTTDDLSRAALTALQLRQHNPTMDLVLVTVRVAADSQSIPTDAIGRAVSLLGEEIDGVVVDDITASLLEAHFALKIVRGRQVIVSERLAEFDRSPPLLGRHTPTVGRERELRLLDGMLQDCISDSQAQAVLITADAGIGKSRLRRAWVEKLLTETPPMWIESTGKSVEWSEMALIAYADPMGTGASLNVLGQLLRQAAGIKSSDAPKFQQHKLRKRLTAVFGEQQLREVGPFLAEIAGIRWEDTISPIMLAARMNPSLMGDRVRLAWLDWISGECAQHPMVLVIEDLQWADEASISLLDATLKHCSKQSLMVLGLARPEVHKAFPKLWAARGALLLALGELTAKAATALVQECLPADVNDRLVELIVNRSGGNALFLEELIRAEHQRRVSGKSDAHFSMPESVLAQVQARLQGLSHLERRVLRVASVFGEQFWVAPTVQLLHDCNPVEIRRALAVLEGQELIRRAVESRYVDHEQFSFRQRMIRDAAYDMLTAEDRAATHQWVAQWLLSEGERDVSRIADHFLQGRETQLASKYLTEAAEIALETSDLPGALAFSAKALACGVDDETRANLQLICAEAHRWRGENQEAFAAACIAYELLPRFQDPWFRAAKEIIHTAGRLLQKDKLREVCEALSVSSGAVLSQAEVAACTRASENAAQSGYAELAERLFLKVTAEDGTVDLEEPWIQASIDALRAIRALTSGDIGRAAEGYQSTAALYEALGDMRLATIHSLNGGFALGQLGAYEKAEATLRRGLVHAEKIGLLDLVSGLQYNLSFVLGRLQRLDEALAYGRRALADYSTHGNRLFATMAKIYMADALYWSGEYNDSFSLANEAATEGSDGPFGPAAFAVGSNAALAKGDTETALRMSSRGVQIVETVGGNNTMEIFLRVAHAQALFAAGDALRGEETLRVAMDRYAFRLESIRDPVMRERFRRFPQENEKLLQLAEHYLRDTLETLAEQANSS